MSCLSTILKEQDEGLPAPVREVHQASSWLELMQAVWGVVCRVAVLVLEEQLTARAQRPVAWPNCPRCGHRLQSNGWRSRRLRTWFGEIGWRRRVGRCPKGCRGSQVAVLDDALGLHPQQRYGEEMVALGCRLAVFVPYETAGSVLTLLILCLRRRDQTHNG